MPQQGWARSPLQRLRTPSRRWQRKRQGSMCCQMRRLCNPRPCLAALQPSETQPGLTLGMRGAMAFEVEVEALRSDVHSGKGGGCP